MYDWQFSIYAARKILGWSLEEFWESSPALLHCQLRENLKYQRRSCSKGKKAQPRKPIEIRYADQLPKGVW